MQAQRLIATAQALVAGDRGLLAMDESTGTCNKRFAELGIPLTEEALEIVERCRELASNDYLFPAYKGKPISDMAMSALMKREGLEARPHGFRATFRTWSEECTDAPFEVKEAVLGHAVDVGVVGAYQRSDRLKNRTPIMEKWTSFVKM